MADERHLVFRKLYKKLVALYPKPFRERFGESMMQTFDDLWRERVKGPAGAARTAGTFGFALRLCFNTCAGVIREHLFYFTQRNSMNEKISNSRRAAILSFILALPMTIMFFLFKFGIEPPFASWLDDPDPDKPDVIGSLIVLVLALLLPVAFIIILRPIRQSIRAGSGLTASPLNLILAAGIFLIFASFVGHIVVDQYPCWMGVPNCD